MTIFQLLCTPLIGETPFAMTYFLTNGRLCPNNGRRRGDCSPRQRSRIVGRHVTWNNLKYVETRNPSHFIELASGSGPFFGLDWQSCALLPTSYWRPDGNNDLWLKYWDLRGSWPFPLVHAWAVSMGFSYIWKCKLNTLNMHGRVVDQKLSFLHVY